MTRLDRVIKAFDDYDNIIKKYAPDIYESEELDALTIEVSRLIGELKRHGCRRKD